MKILVAVDGSRSTRRMLAYLAAHDEWLGSGHAYTVLHVAPPLPARVAAVVERAALEAWHAEQSERVFRPIRRFFERQGIAARFVARVGPAAEVIAASAARGRHDLVLMGSRGHGRLATMALGSVATGVLARGTTPVLLVR